MEHHALPGSLEDIVLAICEGLAVPRACTVAILCRYGEWDQLANLATDPSKYLDSEEYWAAVQATDLLRKCADLETTVDRKAAAVKGFYAAEALCFRANYRLSGYLDMGDLTLQSSDIAERLIVRARKRIADVLGRCPDLLQGRFGPGSTYGDTGVLTTVPDKMTSRPTITRDAIPYLFQWSGTAWATACAGRSREPEFVPGNRFTTVPKDCRKDRGIAVEPSVNLFYQLAFGQVLKGRLRAAGLDLLHAQDIHRQVVCEASIRGDSGTIDLSSASDTVSYNLVKLLLPTRWFEALSALRSPKTLVEKRWVWLEKFSSMGNGYTFELETLIFASLVSAVMEESQDLPVWGQNVHTFGDDIIVPTSHYSNVCAALRFFGMVVNEEKSFGSGPFRESCGGDFFAGVGVRPYQMKEFPSEPQQYVAMANGLRRSAFQAGASSGLRFTALRRAWFRVLDALPSDIRRLRGPEGLGDLVIHDGEDRWNVRWRHSIRYIRVYRPARFSRVGWEHFWPDVVLACAVYGTGDGALGPPGNRSEPLGVTPRDAVTGYKIGWVPFS
jgi:hypothetical protein